MRGEPARGFAYVWLLIVVAIMGVSWVAVAQLTTLATQRDQERALLVIGQQFREALGRYKEQQKSSGPPGADYPASLEDLLQDTRTPGITRHLRQIFVDPLTGQREWGLVRVGGRIVGVHSLSERRPIKQAGFEPDDAQFAGRQSYREWVFTYPANLTLSEGGQAGQPPGQATQPGQIDQPLLPGQPIPAAQGEPLRVPVSGQPEKERP